MVIDFVGELGVENICWKMVRKGGQLFVVGYGGAVNVPTAHLVIEEINIGGSLVGNFTELVELMELNADGKVKPSEAISAPGIPPRPRPIPITTWRACSA